MLSRGEVEIHGDVPLAACTAAWPAPSSRVQLTALLCLLQPHSYDVADRLRITDVTSRTGVKILLCVQRCLGCSYKELGEANSWVTCASPSWCPCWDSIRATQPWLACLELGHGFTTSGLQCCLSLNVRKVEVEHSLAINTVSSDVYWINYV